MRRLLFTAGWVVIQLTQTVLAQNVSLPNVLPASPEPASIAKGGNIYVSLSSGMANASIPLHELKIGKHSLYASLNYSSNGYKVDEISSRVGTGWNLSLGGVITRTVRGRPDDKSVRKYLPQGNISLQQEIDYYDHLTMPQYDWDNEPDEFSISAPGLNGKFILDSNGAAVKIPYNNNRIEVTMSNTEIKVLVTDPAGVKYYFGYDNKYEKTQSHSVQGPLTGFQSVITALFLTKIKYPDSTTITYNYDTISYSVENGVSQSLSTGLQTNLTDPAAQCHCTGSYPALQGGTVGPGSLQTHLSSVVYNSFILQSITTSDYQSITFNYDPRPDGQGDKRIKSIYFSGGNYSKIYNLLYENMSNNIPTYGYPYGSINSNYFLKEVDQIINNDINPDTLRYQLSYFDLQSVPARFSYGQDHMGFYNGKPNYTLLPSTPNTSEANWGTQYATADRNPDHHYSRIGMLTRVTYPTGGYDEFDYEPNQFAVLELVNTMTTKSVEGSGNTVNGSYQAIIYYSPSFTIQQNQNANVSFSAYANPGCSGCTPPPPNTTNIANLYIQDLTTGLDISSDLLRDYNTTNFNVALVASHSYKLKLVVRGLPNAARAEIAYDYSGGPQYVTANHEAPGLRVKSIKSFDPVSVKQVGRYFSYKKAFDSVGSSAIYLFKPDYFTDNHITTLCQTDLDSYELSSCRMGYSPPITAYETSKFKTRTLSSNSAYLNYGFDGNQILYKNVIESDDPAYANGYIEHQYEGYSVTNWTLINGYMIKSVPTNTVTTINGYERQTNYYNKTRALLKKMENYYSYSGADYINQVDVLMVNKRGSHVLVDWGSTEIMMDPYDIVEYNYQSFWIQLDSSITTDYANNESLKIKSTYYYGLAINTQPVKTETVNSTGDIITSESTYPTDYPSSSVYQTMVANNIIVPVVESKQKKNNTDISLVRTNYKTWYNSPNVLIVEPEFIEAKKGNNYIETRIRYYSFDPSGNPLELSKENGKHISYLWDYKNRLPVAEVQNASQSDIAYTSFEAESTGNWNYDEITITSAMSRTGSKSAFGSLYKTTDPSKTYIVTIWVNEDGDANAFVNGQWGTLIWYKAGWKLYKWVIPNPTSININGRLFDDVRLYPLGAQMVTYTYFPDLGIRDVSDINCRITRYEYDAGMRLKLIRDIDSSILKQFDYQYKKPIYPCASTAADWQSTGQLRCYQGGTNNNFNGTKEEEKIDLNNCSVTYLQRSWFAVAGSYPECTAVPNCNGPDKRVIIVNGAAGCYTGSKVLVTSIQVGPSSWECTYHYVWFDGFVGPNFTETSSTNCGSINNPD